MRLASDYEPGMSGRLCFITGRARGEVDDVIPGGSTERRPERVVVTDRMIVFGDPPPEPGLIAINESTVWVMGRMVGMVPEGEVVAARSQANRHRATIEEQRETIAALKGENAALRARLDAGVRL